MGKISLYILLFLIYLGFSKSSVSINENRPFLKSEKVFDSFFQNAPISVILLNFFERGFFLRSYYFKIRLVHAYLPYEDLEIQTSSQLYSKYRKNLGMAIYQRKTLELPGSAVPQPAGAIFIGDFTFGTWKMDNSGERYFDFHRAYRRFPQILVWGNFKPSLEFLEKLKILENYNQPFYGLNNEFGTNGRITEKYLKPKEEEKKRYSFWSYFKKIFTWPDKRTQKK